MTRLVFGSIKNMVKRDPNSPVVFRDLQEMADAILAGVSEMFKEFGEKVDKRFVGLEADMKYVKQELGSLKIDTPSASEFKRLKERVDEYVGV